MSASTARRPARVVRLALPDGKAARDQQRIDRGGPLAQLQRELKTVHARQAQIEQHDFQHELFGKFERGHGLVRNTHVVTIRLQHQRHSHRGVDAVIHPQQAQRRRRGLVGVSEVSQRQTYDEFAALAGPLPAVFICACFTPPRPSPQGSEDSEHTKLLA